MKRIRTIHLCSLGHV